MFSRMPVPVWDADMVFYEEPLDTTTVVSDDIWKKFDLDNVMDNYQYRYKNELLGEANGLSAGAQHEVQTLLPPMPLMMHHDRNNCPEFREIRHHDCMWAGLCISKEHNRTQTAKRESLIQRRIPAGRSILIPKKHQQQQQGCHHVQHNGNNNNNNNNGHSMQSSHCSAHWQQHQQRSILVNDSCCHGTTTVTTTTTCCRTTRSGAAISGMTTTTAMGATTTTKHLESDGDSTRPETPQSSESETESEEDDDDDEEEDEDEAPVFKHEQISIHDIVSASEVTGQQIQRRPGFHDRRKEDERTQASGAAGVMGALQHYYQQQSAEAANTNMHLMSDHCYHLNQQPSANSKKFEHLGVQTPSDSEEEIDVVSYEKPVRPATSAAALSLPTYPNPAVQLTVNTAFKDRQSNGAAVCGSCCGTSAGSSCSCSCCNSNVSDVAVASPAPVAAPTPRPRGRPPLNPANRKRPASQQTAQQPAEPKPAKRARQHTTRPYTKRSTPTKAQVQAQAQLQLQQQQQQQQQLLQQQQQHYQQSKASSSPQSSPSKSNASSRSSSDDEPDTEKRSLHNNMERQRRVELRNAFEDLRVLVPEVEAKDKAPKVAILKHAAIYCDRLADIEQLSIAKVFELKQKQERLRAQLSHLRRSLAIHMQR